MIIIRKYEPKDRNDVRRISCETSFLEHPRALIFDDDEILADALTLYFTDYEPESCFVAVQDGRVAGYVIGSTNVARMQKVCNARISPPLVIKALARGVFFRLRNLKLLCHILKSLIKGEFIMPAFTDRYPATLHINLEQGFRSGGTGARLIETYLQYLKEKGVSGLHFGTFSEGASRFFLKTGFKVLFRGKRSYLKPYLGKEVNLYIFGKEGIK